MREMSDYLGRPLNSIEMDAEPLPEMLDQWTKVGTLAEVRVALPNPFDPPTLFDAYLLSDLVQAWVRRKFVIDQRIQMNVGTDAEVVERAAMMAVASLQAKGLSEKAAADLARSQQQRYEQALWAYVDKAKEQAERHDWCDEYESSLRSLRDDMDHSVWSEVMERGCRTEEWTVTRRTPVTVWVVDSETVEVRLDADDPEGEAKRLAEELFEEVPTEAFEQWDYEVGSDSEFSADRY